MKAAIMGYGTIGSGVFEVLRENREQMKRRRESPSRSNMCSICGTFPGHRRRKRQ